MAQGIDTLLHPGTFIREHVIPKGMSVKDAAERLGVGRPALSNLLNGKSSLSPEMAVRLEKAFGADGQKLLDRQAVFGRHGRSGGDKVVAVRAYVPPFLTIKAAQIHDWAENNIEARQLLPVLLRKLVHSTGLELRHVDFPGYDNAERKGSDGLIEAGAATPWIPEGKSYWEFGTNQNPGEKAKSDYLARLDSVPPAERPGCSFVFVTPRNWRGKTDWSTTKNAAGHWKAVRALDASDLEQWLEESIPAQIWLAERLAMPVSGFSTLDQCWQRWAEASDPCITPAIFEPSITTNRATFNKWLEKPSERPFVVAADSKDEALAFLACLFQDPATAVRSRDLAAVFESARTLRSLAAASSPFIPIVRTDEAERELATVYRRLHCIVVRPRNAIDSEPDIALDLLGHDAFETVLADMGIDHDTAERLARETGRSPTILRRRLSRIDAIRTPPWANDEQTARSLIPMTFVGAWHAKSSADCEVVRTLADTLYQKIEENIAKLLHLDDCPVWSVGQYRGVSSKIDVLFAINRLITEKDITEFFWLAEYVISESDPALELPEDKRWAAGLYGKVRDHSSALRVGICETLVVLAVYGNNLFRDRLGVDLEACVSNLILRLLAPLTLDKLLSHDRGLPYYAEAAPDAFLKLLESDLQKPSPTILGLMKPADSSVFGGCPRSGLLWSLECLAWKNLGRVSVLLAQLSRTVIEDNWGNKPIASLEAIFRSWMPQTAASLEERKRALEILARRFPDIGWQICTKQFEVGPQIGHHSYRPRWRSDASGAGQPVTAKENHEFARKALDLALAWPKHDARTLGDLLERLQRMSEADQATVWDLIDTWADSTTDDEEKALLRERIRRFAFTRRSKQRGLKEATKDKAAAAYAKLEASDPVIRHAWLLSKHWVEESASETEEEDPDDANRGERIHTLRAAAMQEVWTDRGFDGVTEVLSKTGAPDVVGRYLAPVVTGAKARAAFLRSCLSVTGDLERKVDGCVHGYLSSLDGRACGVLLSSVTKGADVDQIVRLFRCAPFGRDTWRLLDRHGEDIRNRYWREVFPSWNRHSEAELMELVDRLLDAKRPRAAFHAVHLDWPQIETSRLKRLLLAVATVDEESAENFKLDPYEISAALESLDGRTGVSPDEMAQLEFLFIEALDGSEHGIPNLERQIATSPATFVQAMALTYKRDDGGQDPPEWKIEDPARRSAVASAAHSVLRQIKRLPGTGPDGKVNAEELFGWVTEVRRLSAEHGRAQIGDHQIGQLLSRVPGEEDGEWPGLPVCEVMELLASEHIARGFTIGVYNARGAHWRGEGGAQERDLAAKYRGWANRRAVDYPYVGSVLEGIANDYDRQAVWEDSRAKIGKRLPY